MREILLDTDIGGDCDDAGALVLLKTLCLQGKACLSAVTSCTTMDGAAETVCAILEYYGLKVPVGVMTGEPFMCDGDFNRYAEKIKEEFGGQTPTKDAISLMRKTLAEAKGKVTLIGIGPQRNLARLLESKADDISPLDGAALIAEKVQELVIMAGMFLAEEKAVVFEGKKIIAEWNVEQDISAAQKVAEQWPSQIVYSPFELGYDILTGRYLPAGSPARRCYDIRCGLARSSWDLCAAYYGAVGCGHLFRLSEKGKVSFDDKGVSAFEPCAEGKHRILCAKASVFAVEKRLESLIK